MSTSEVHATASRTPGAREEGRSAELPLAAKGFRPFFLLAALWAVLGIPLWLVVYGGAAGVGGPLVGSIWHAHEMVFGFTIAVVAGFLLTAVERWTGRTTARGGALLALAALWTLGRVALFVDLGGPSWLPAAIDLAFLPALAFAIARPVVLAGSWRNLVFPLALLGLAAANLGTYLGARGEWLGGLVLGPRLGLDLVILMAVVVTGRIVPLFTRGALASISHQTSSEAPGGGRDFGVARTGDRWRRTRRYVDAIGGSTRRKRGWILVSQPMDGEKWRLRAEDIRRAPWLERATALGVAAFAVLEATRPGGTATAVVAAATAVLATARMHAWGTLRSLRDPLLAVLHVGAAWIPVGLALRAATIWSPELNPTAGTHALTLGVIGMLTLGMMVRVALGHTGRKLVAERSMIVAFALMALAAPVRLVGVFLPPHLVEPTLHASGTLWTLAFLLYLVVFTPRLLGPRVDGAPG